MRKLKRLLWLIVAAAFLVEAWLWDQCVLIGRALVARLPWDRFKAWLARTLEPLPPPLALLVFIIPLAIIEPFKIAALWLIATRHWFLGGLCFLAAKVIGFGVIAFLFDLLRDKLLSMPWMARLYDWLMYCRKVAHEFVDPYKAALHERIHDLREALRIRFGRNARGFWAKMRRLRRRYWRSSPPA